MIEYDVAATEIRRLSRLKNYPRSWGEGDSAASQQDQQAETALIQAAAEAPDMYKLRRFVGDWERRHVDAPVPAVLYEAWRAGARYQGIRRRKCDLCGDSGWFTRHYVAAAISGDRDRVYIDASEIEDWWGRIRSTPTCSQRVYDEAMRCHCGTVQEPIAADQDQDGRAYRDFAARAAGDREQ